MQKIFYALVLALVTTFSAQAGDGDLADRSPEGPKKKFLTVFRPQTPSSISMSVSPTNSVSPSCGSDSPMDMSRRTSIDSSIPYQVEMRLAQYARHHEQHEQLKQENEQLKRQNATLATAIADINISNEYLDGRRGFLEEQNKKLRKKLSQTATTAVKKETLLATVESLAARTRDYLKQIAAKDTHILEKDAQMQIVEQERADAREAVEKLHDQVVQLEKARMAQNSGHSRNRRTIFLPSSRARTDSLTGSPTRSGEFNFPSLSTTPITGTPEEPLSAASFSVTPCPTPNEKSKKFFEETSQSVLTPITEGGEDLIFV